jgi:phosphohistidine phosphatase
MSRKLILLRHSKAESYGSVQDFARELTPSGRKKAGSAAKQILKKGLTPQLIVSSGAKRALQTAQIVAQSLGLDTDSILVDDEIYHMRGVDFLPLVNALPDSLQTVLIVGHNPAISEAAYNFSADLEANHALSLGLSTANAAVLKSSHKFSDWTWKAVPKCKLLLVDA